MIDYVQLENYGRKNLCFGCWRWCWNRKKLNFLLWYFFRSKNNSRCVDALEKYNEYFNSNEKYYDLIISDIQMPNMNGIELIKMFINQSKAKKLLYYLHIRGQII